MTDDAATRTLVLEPSPGAKLITDHLPGRAPAYVYMHGLTADRFGAKSDALLAHATRRGRGFARFDFRGHGRSSGRLGGVTVSELIEDGAEVLRHIGPAIVVGSSLGGLIAAWLAAGHRDLVRGLVLISPAFGFLTRMARHDPGEPMALEADNGTRVLLQGRVLSDAAKYDEAGLPRRLTMPVLLVHGERDPTVPARESQRCFDGIPHDRKVLWLVPGGDHSLDASIREVYRRMDELID